MAPVAPALRVPCPSGGAVSRSARRSAPTGRNSFAGPRRLRLRVSAAASPPSGFNDGSNRLTTGWNKPSPPLNTATPSGPEPPRSVSSFTPETAPNQAVAYASAARLAALLKADTLLYSDVTLSGNAVEFSVVVDGYMGKVAIDDVARVHSAVAKSLAPMSSEARNRRNEPRVCVRFPFPKGAVSAASLPAFSPLAADSDGDVADESVDGFKFLLDQHTIHNRVLSLMEKGSDDRSIFTGEERLGKYYTGMRPLTDRTIHRGTCTSSSPTPGAYAAAVEAAKMLWTGAPNVENNLLCDMRARIQKLFCPDIGTFTFHPSGTDAESVPLLYAILQSRALAHRLDDQCGKIVSQGRVVSIVTCASEVGSGTLDAARGCYFSTETPLNATGVAQGKQLPYLHRLANIEAIAFQGRGDDGARVATMEEDILATARAKLDEDPTTVVVLHTIAGSKTGMFAPSWDVTETLTREYGKERIVAVLDACQMRHASTLIPRWLEDFGLVMITASKYYGGPSFAGGVLLSNDTVHRMQSALDEEGSGVQKVVAKALAAYLTRNEICTRMPALCGAFGEDEHTNTGLVLRWAAGLYEMETLQAAIEAVGVDVAESRMERWVLELRSMVESLGPQLDLLPVEDYPDTDYQFGRINSIISIRISNNAGGYRSTEELKMVYGAMYNDITNTMPAEASEEELSVAGRQCLLGQPVPIQGNAVLRTCMGGPQMKELLETDDFETCLQQMLVKDRIVLEKLAMVGRNFETLFPRAA